MAGKSPFSGIMTHIALDEKGVNRVIDRMTSPPNPKPRPKTRPKSNRPSTTIDQQERATEEIRDKMNDRTRARYNQIIREQSLNPKTFYDEGHEMMGGFGPEGQESRPVRHKPQPGTRERGA